MLTRAVFFRTVFHMALAFLCSVFNVCAFSTEYSLPYNGEVVGETLIINAAPGDTLQKIAFRYDMGINEMLRANPDLKSDQLLDDGTEVVVPKRFILPRYRKGIVINLAELRLYYFAPDHQNVYTFPVGVGRKGWRTPTGLTYVVNKKSSPDWNVPAVVRANAIKNYHSDPGLVVPAGDPLNPLGNFALYLGFNGILIHGTNQSEYVGDYVSSGCIRLYNDDVETLYSLVNKSTPVYIVHHSTRAGWRNEKLYVESNRNMELDGQSDLKDEAAPEAEVQAVSHEHGLTDDRIDWDRVERVIQQGQGIPTPVSGNT